MEAHELRVVEEKKVLDIKIEDLRKFIATPFFVNRVSEAEQSRLIAQHMVMEKYSDILNDRIENF